MNKNPIGPLEACAATITITMGLGILVIYFTYIISVSF